MDEVHFLIEAIEKRRKINYLEQARLHLLPNMNQEQLSQFYDSLMVDDSQPNVQKESSKEDIEKALKKLKMIEKGGAVN